MRPRLGSLRVGLPTLVALTLPLPIGLPPSPAPPPPPTRQPPKHRHTQGALGVRIATTGKRAELVRALPITKRPLAAPRVVLSLRLPKVRKGEVVRLAAEAQASTTCPPVQSLVCIGHPYGFNPTLTGRLVLTDRSGAVGGAGTQTVATRRVTCFQRAPNRNHHCVLVFTPPRVKPKGAARDACATRCYANLVLAASNPHARGHELVVIGADRPNHQIVQGSARLGAMVLPHGTARHGVATVSRRPLLRRLPLRPRGHHRKRVIYSVEIAHPARGDRILASARTRLAIRHLPYNVYLRSQLILARSPTATGPGRVAVRSSISGGTITPANGFNCTRGRSGFRSPCPVRKAGLTVIRRVPRGPSGHAVPLYVNLVTGAKALIAKPRARDGVRVMRGALRVVRYRGR